MTRVWKSTNNGKIDETEVPDIKVRVIRQHCLKAPGFLEKTKGLEFTVIIKREGGYDIDMTPLGHPGERGFVHDTEAEEIND